MMWLTLVRSVESRWGGVARQSVHVSDKNTTITRGIKIGIAKVIDDLKENEER